MNTYCDDCKRCTGGCMVKSEVEGDDHNRCSECEATLQSGMAEADSMIDALRARVEKLERVREAGKLLQEACNRRLVCPFCLEKTPTHRGNNCPVWIVEDALAECEEVDRG